MRLPILHHHCDSSVVFASMDARTEQENNASDELKPMPLTDPETYNDGAGKLIPIIAAMQQQESENGAYNPSGRFAYRTEQPQDGEQRNDDYANKKKILVVDERCRSKMLEWCTKMVDYFDIDRSIVALSAYYQDRFLGTEMGKAARSNRAIFRVVSVTSLYIAIKLRVPHRWNVTAHAFAQLCQGSVSGDEINDMELNILFALKWNVNPPIPMEYAEAYLDLIFNSAGYRTQRTWLQLSDDDSVLGVSLMSSSDESSSSEDSAQQDGSRTALKDHILELVKYQLEMSLQDNRLYQVRSSVIATAAIVNSLEGVMNESLCLREGVEVGSFCRDSIILTLDSMTSCKIASEKELEIARSILLSSAVSSADGSEELSSVNSTLTHASHVKNCADHRQRPDTPPVSSSPTSASKFWPIRKMHEHAVTPQSILAQVFAFHYI